MGNKIKHINIAVTNRCNLSCRQCSIWQEKPKKDISLQNIKNIIQSEVLDDDVNIALTGGESFLHKNFAGIAKLIFLEKPGCLKSISTNGTLKGSMMDLLNECGKLIPEFSLYISLDGINRHDAQRGRSLSAITNSIKFIKEAFPALRITLKFTITKINYTDIMPTYEYAKSNNLSFKIKLVENAENYTNKISTCEIVDFNAKERRLIAEDLLSVYNDLKGRNEKDAFFINRTIKFLLGKTAPAFCRTPFNRIFVMPDGEVYSCIHFNSIGNINHKSLEEIWYSKKAELIRAEIKQHGCNKCASYHGFSLS